MRRARGRLAYAYELDPGERDEGKLLYSPYVMEGYRSLKNPSAPHLHFQVMDGLLSLASNGLPYVIDSYTVTGKAPARMRSTRPSKRARG